MNKSYLGDSVYVETENGMLKLTTNNGYHDDPRNVIFMEPEVYTALTRYVARLEQEQRDAAPSASSEEKK